VLRSVLTGTVLPPPGRIRPFAAANLVRTVGSGLLLATSMLYFVRVVGLAPAQVGAGLSVAAAVAVLAGLPAGRLADLLGPRRLTVLLTVGHGVAVAGFALAGSFWAFVTAASLAVSFEAGTQASRGALVASALPGSQRVEARAYMRAVSNVGVSAGVALGGLALYLDSPTAYRIVLVACGLCLCASALFYLALPEAERRPGAAGGPLLHFEVLRDRPYMTVTALNAVLASHDAILTVALPLWISTRTDVPPWVYSVLVLTNTVLVIALQVRLSRGIDTVAASARSLTRAGWTVAASCVLFGLAGGQARWVAVVLLLLGAVVHVLGELQQSAGSWGLAYELAPEHAQGEYQGMFSTSLQVAGIVTPFVAGALLVGRGLPGWLLFALVLVLAATAVPRAAAWAQRRQVPAAADPPS
jgi:MFS family permease